MLVARDMRPSGVELTRAFADGVTSAGVDVVDLGLTSTDELYFASGSMDAPGAMFTASHNPAQYNGIKLCLSGARPVGADTGLREIMAAVMAIGRDGYPDGGRSPGTVTPGRRPRRATPRKVRSFVDVAALRPLKVVADTANGMGGLVVPAVFEGLPFRAGDPLRRARRHLPEPSRRSDPAREPGRSAATASWRPAPTWAWPSTATPTAASWSTTRAYRSPARRRPRWWPRPCSTSIPGATILYNLICSKAVPEIIRERGGIPVRTRVGHSYIKAIMADTDALFGGEHSGHYYFRDNYRADSGSIAALVVLEVLSKAGRPLSDVRTDFERYADSGEINTEVADPAAVIEAVASPLQRRQPGPPGRPDGRPRRRGGSTCGRPTPNRCSGSTSKPPTARCARPGPRRSWPDPERRVAGRRSGRPAGAGRSQAWTGGAGSSGSARRTLADCGATPSLVPGPSVTAPSRTACRPIKEP